MKQVFKKLNEVIQNELSGIAVTVQPLEGTKLDTKGIVKLPAILIQQESIVQGDSKEFLTVNLSLFILSKIRNHKDTARYKDKGHSSIIEAVLFKLSKGSLKLGDDYLGIIQFKSSTNLYSQESPEYLKEVLRFTIKNVPHPTDYDESDLNDFKTLDQSIEIEDFTTQIKEALNG